MSPVLALWLTLTSSNYPCLEHNFHGFEGVRGEEVRRKIQAAIGEYDTLLTLVKKLKLR